MERRTFLKGVAAGTAVAMTGMAEAAKPKKQPNLVFVFSDQWRASDTGYAGNPDVKTPNLDRLAQESVNFTHAVSNCPVCCPYRGTLLTGQFPDKHGIFLNDASLGTESTSIAQALNGAGYDTGWIGKWHLDGQGRMSYIPKERRQGFQYWKVMECTHNYVDSFYYADTPKKLRWDGVYDAFAQTRDAQEYIKDHADEDKPFALFLSWGPPHAPYLTAPQKYKDMYDPAKVTVPPNVPKESEKEARKNIAGYYAHCTALDDCVGALMGSLEDLGLAEDTIFVVTSDHGDMLGSRGQYKKQRPWDESIRVPFLLRYPKGLGDAPREIDAPINSPDIMPTMLGLCGITPPDSVQGEDWTPVLLGTEEREDNAAMIACYHPFGQWTRKQGGREFRGVRTKRYTYCRSLEGPWLLYDNVTDPYQMENLIDRDEMKEIQADLEAQLQVQLAKAEDEFLHGDEYVKRWGYEVDASGTLPYGA